MGARVWALARRLRSFMEGAEIAPPSRLLVTVWEGTTYFGEMGARPKQPGFGEVAPSLAFP